MGLKDRAVPFGRNWEKYAKLFPSGTGSVAKPLRMPLGALLIQAEYRYSDEEKAHQIQETPCLQYF
jgi:hypothetical protein